MSSVNHATNVLAEVPLVRMSLNLKLHNTRHWKSYIIITSKSSLMPMAGLLLKKLQDPNLIQICLELCQLPFCFSMVLYIDILMIIWKRKEKPLEFNFIFTKL